MVTLGILPSAFWLLSCSFYFYDRFALWQYCTLVLEYNFATTFHLANNLSCLTLVLLITNCMNQFTWFFHTLFYYPSAYQKKKNLGFNPITNQKLHEFFCCTIYIPDLAWSCLQYMKVFHWFTESLMLSFLCYLCCHVCSKQLNLASRTETC